MPWAARPMFFGLSGRMRTMENLEGAAISLMCPILAEDRGGGNPPGPSVLERIETLDF